jgi:large subunit ribosomal protein L20
MPRVKRGTMTKKRHKRVLKEAKGYRGDKHAHFKQAKEQLLHSGDYAYRHRRQKKREFRSLWILRISAACKSHGISYSKFINGLKKANILLNRKMLSEIAIKDPNTFTNLVEKAKSALT